MASFSLMLAKRGVMPHGDDWQYELKFDGYRLLARTGEPAVRLREGGDATLDAPPRYRLGMLTAPDFGLEGVVGKRRQVGVPLWRAIARLDND
ncbi:hypothetical protein KB879_06330 [Cupriavidus sp. KK10]|uniref:hypothetical protein n=1 Tax=Cupriavidus sp. KK10 TaxID=1478019 RepID=UPI001BA9FB20|nr:hypothetical protein [Cupriavidus sp. KK10]QUN29562.1 hypothetical protein KB879_06330 [Cupriavidus sp. KK10]